MPRSWNESRLRNFIESETEESLTLEYKSAEALSRSDFHKQEITKDVSALANSAGGLLVYGIRESNDPARRHLPELITPVNRTEFPREWLEQVINSIRPRIDGLLIHSVQLSTGEEDVAYIVDVPQSNTAHQASNHRYYKRFNFQSVPMEDYEIRDVLFREKMPSVEVRFFLEKKIGEGGPEQNLFVQARNGGSAYARYVACFVDVPVGALVSLDNPRSVKDGGRYYRHRLTNLNQDYADETFRANFPLLRSMSMSWSIPLKPDYPESGGDPGTIKWKLYADNALPQKGSIAIKELEIIDLRKKSA
ncbi:MAG: ATP-binding protein [Pyrinomonadaceae bacterium]